MKDLLKLCLPIISAFAFVQLGHAQAVKNPPATSQTQSISYWFSWSQGNSQYQAPTLADIANNGVNTVDVAFALENKTNNGLTLQLWNYDQLAKDIASLQQSKVKVFLSTGGATGPYPWNVPALSDEQVANQFIDYINKYHFNGIDFDVEDNDGVRLPNIIALIKKGLPNLSISLTVPSTGDNSSFSTKPMQDLAYKLYSEGALNYINLMNYDQNWVPGYCTYENDNMQQNCYIQNIQAMTNVINTWTNDATKTKSMISNGIMSGYGDDKKIVTPTLARELTQWLKQNGYGAVMTWGISRDQSTDTKDTHLDYSTGMTGIPALTYTKTIAAALASSK
jgi:chitinase